VRELRGLRLSTNSLRSVHAAPATILYAVAEDSLSVFLCMWTTVHNCSIPMGLFMPPDGPNYQYPTHLGPVKIHALIDASSPSHRPATQTFNARQRGPILFRLLGTLAGLNGAKRSHSSLSHPPPALPYP